MKIGFDLDSVLNDLQSVWSAWIRETHDPAWTTEKWTSWDVHKLTPAGKKAYDFLLLPGIFRTIPLEPGAVAGTKRLAEAGHDLYVITSSIPENWVDKVWWLRQHFPHIPEKNYIVSSSKGLIGVDVLVDDGIHNFEGFKGRGILYDRPWNRGDRKLERAVSFDHLERLLNPVSSFSCGLGDGLCGIEHELATMSIIAIADDFANRKEI